METKESNAPYIINLINSIIGVSVLAMPFCLKKCGLILGLSLLIGMSWLTYISCNMLVTSAIVKRRRTYEYLAFYTVGPTGKFAVELSMIGLMLGTCVAFYVIIGDLATAILQEKVDAAPEQLRTLVIIFCALCIALPLGLMKNLSALGFIGMFSMLFYCLFVCVMLANSVSSGFFSLAWLDKVHFFRPAGVFQCLPIFSLAYACQCQLFVVYDSLEDASLMRMETIVTVSLKIVTFVYCTVAVLGYTTYLDNVDGNVLKNFSPNFILDLIKIGFAISVVVGFPLMIFPCRQSIHTLFFSQHPTESPGIASKTYIEPFMFKAITLCIVLSTMMVALFIPNVETILGLTGATMGSSICFIFPGIIFTKALPKEDSGISKFVLGVGCVLLVLCTYSNVYSATETQNPIPINPQLPDSIKHKDDVKDIIPSKPPIAEVVDLDHRHEPPNPVEPILPHNEKENNNVPDNLAKVPAQVDHPLPDNEIRNKGENLNPEQKINSNVQEKPIVENNLGEAKEKENKVNIAKVPELKNDNLVNIPKNEPAKPALKEDDRIEKKKESDTDQEHNKVDDNIQMKSVKPVEQKPIESHVHNVESPLKKDEAVQKNQAEQVEKRDAAEETKNEKAKDDIVLIDEEKILKQLKEQQEKQQQLLQEEGHLIKFLEKSQNDKQADKQNIQQSIEKNIKPVEKPVDNSLNAGESDLNKNSNKKLADSEFKNIPVHNDPNMQDMQPQIGKGNQLHKIPENPAPVVDTKKNNVPNVDNAQNKESIELKKQAVNEVVPQPIGDLPPKVVKNNDVIEHHRESRDIHDNTQNKDEKVDDLKQEHSEKEEQHQPQHAEIMSNKVLNALNHHVQENPIDSVNAAEEKIAGNGLAAQDKQSDNNIENTEKKPNSRDLKSVSME